MLLTGWIPITRFILWLFLQRHHLCKCANAKELAAKTKTRGAFRITYVVFLPTERTVTYRIRTARHFIITVHFELWPSCCSICHSRHQHTWCRRYTNICQWAVGCLCCLHLCDTPWRIFHSAKDCGSEQQSKEKHAGLILHVVGHPGSFDTLYFTNYISWCTKSFPGKLNYG